MINGSNIVFYLLSAMILGSGLLAVTSKHIFRAAIFLLFSLIGMAGMYFWLDYQFIAAVQIVVYVGGITVLIIFSIFLTQQAGEKLPEQTFTRKFFAALATFCSFAFVMLQILQHQFTEVTTSVASPAITDIGNQMLGIDKDGYVLPFEVVSILLLAALIGCIVIAVRTKPLTTT